MSGSTNRPVEDAYDAWCREHGCTHGHCAHDCEKPQPLSREGKLVCGRCYFKYDELVPMIPCTPEVCD